MGSLAEIELAVPSQGSTKSFTKSFNIISIEWDSQKSWYYIWAVSSRLFHAAKLQNRLVEVITKKEDPLKLPIARRPDSQFYLAHAFNLNWPDCNRLKTVWFFWLYVHGFSCVTKWICMPCVFFLLILLSCPRSSILQFQFYFYCSYYYFTSTCNFNFTITIKHSMTWLSFKINSRLSYWEIRDCWYQ
jgi:hypothetical protein